MLFNRKQLILAITLVIFGSFITAAAFVASIFLGFIVAGLMALGIGLTLYFTKVPTESRPLTMRRSRKKKKVKISPYWKDTGERMVKTFGQAFLSTFIVPVGFSGVSKMAIAATASGLSALTSIGSRGFGPNKDSASLVTLEEPTQQKPIVSTQPKESIKPIHSGEV